MQTINAPSPTKTQVHAAGRWSVVGGPWSVVRGQLIRMGTSQASRAVERKWAQGTDNKASGRGNGGIENQPL
jgi:hypothetical protein